MPLPSLATRALRHPAALAFVVVATSVAAAFADDPPKPPGAVGIANPASVACVRRGGRSEIRTERDGGQVGYCHLPDGRICEEWALFRDDRCVLPAR
jgi:putative hemolysin